MEILTFSFIGKPKTNPSVDAYRNSFLRVISVIIEIINYPFNLGKMRFKDPPSICLTRKKTQATPMIGLYAVISNLHINTVMSLGLFSSEANARGVLETHFPEIKWIIYYFNNNRNNTQKTISICVY
jgi:hypothetical protein